MRLVVLFLISISTLYANVVGNLSGNLSVNNGALNYNVPLKVPAGIAGHTPSVSLNYNSNGANGYFGQGWSLTGLSTISRCGSNLEFDGIKKGINYTDEDNICLDGQRLVPILGSKWDSGSEYRTKIDTYSKITYDGSKFTVYTKSGEIKEYTLINQAWYLSSSKDKHNNTISYNYTSTSNEVYLDNISYGDNTIQFNYEDKLDKYNGYSGGYNIQITKRVDSIDIKNGSTILRNYNLTYKAQENTVDKSLLEKITESDEEKDLEPLKFIYSSNTFDGTFKSNVYNYDGNLNFGEIDSYPVVTGDFNGDGLTDIYRYANNHYFMMLSNGDDSFDTKLHYYDNNWNFGTTGIYPVVTGDFNGDGLTDIYRYEGLRYYLMLSNGDGTFESKSYIYDNGWNFGATGTYPVVTGDFNGDGLTDIYRYDGLKYFIMLNNGDGTFKSNVYNYDGDLNFGEIDAYPVVTGDFNGDGLTDIYRYANNHYFIMLSNGDGLFDTKLYYYDNGWNFGATGTYPVITGDFNGDGLTDIYRYDASKYFMMLNNGDGTFKSNLFNYDGGLNFGEIDAYPIITKDFNGDGLTDIYRYANNHYFMILSNGDGLFNTKLYYYDNGWNFGATGTYPVVTGDFNGDGLIDIYRYDATNYFMIKSKSEKSKINFIIDSLKNETTINYKYLTKKEIYTKYNDTVYPKQNTQNSMEVVSSVLNKIFTGEESTTTYTYEGLKTNVRGLGSLGFAKIISINDKNNTKIETEYNQDFPYIGLENRISLYKDDLLFPEILNSYRSTENGGVYKVYKYTEQIKTYQDSMHNYVILKENTFDEHGNILEVNTSTKDTDTNLTKQTTISYIYDKNSSTSGELISKRHVSRLIDASKVNQASSSNSDIVGNLSGSLSVNNGVLNYNVPLKLPAGIAGHTPSVSLNYNSNGVNGYFGNGWSLSGLSTISRCGLNFTFDGVKKGIKYNTEDNICLDGQRLVLVSGSKWSSGSQYRTKLDSYSKIIYDGTNFKVYTKSGEEKMYTLKNRVWYLTSIKDRYHNTITYNYITTSSEVYLDNISYGDNKIQLNYENKLDKYSGYFAGYNMQITKRVNFIDIKNFSSIVRTYDFTYKAQNSSLDKSFVESIIECSNGVCLDSLTFFTPIYGNQFTKSSPLVNYPKGQNAQYIATDFNGDGISDIMAMDYGGAEFSWLALSNGNGTFTKTTPLAGYPKGQNARYSVGDFDGDGISDIMAMDHGGAEFSWLALSNGDGTFRKTIPLASYPKGSNARYRVGDFNGDGISDIMAMDHGGSEYSWLALGNRNGTFTKSTPLLAYKKGESAQYIVADFNGDGISDIMAIDPGDATYSWLALSNEDGTFTKSTPLLNYDKGHNTQYRVGDFNGDGISDIMALDHGGIEFSWLALANGDGTFTKSTPLLNYDKGYNTQYRVGDFNGDGISDIMALDHGGVEFSWLALANGDGTFIKSIPLSNYLKGSNARYNVGDFNGDGISDIMALDHGGAEFSWLALESSNNKGKIVKIADSYKNETNINYKYLTDDSVYTKYTGGKYPNIDIQIPIKVVSSVVSKTPTGEDSTTSYTYEGLKTNIKGLGSLGFAKVTSINDLKDVKTVTEYNQNYPLVGTVNKTTTFMGSEVLSEATNTYSSIESNGISKIQLDQSISKNYQDGVHLTTSTNVNSSFDDYGNVLTSTSTIKDETTNEEFITSTVNTYSNDETNWLIGKLTNSLVTSSAYGDTKTKETKFIYDETTGSLLSKTSEPNKDKWLKKSYTYNTNGTLNTQTISGADIQSATTTYGYVYNENTLSNSSITNALGHSVNKTYDIEGKVLSIKDKKRISNTKQS